MDRVEEHLDASGTEGAVDGHKNLMEVSIKRTKKEVTAAVVREEGKPHAPSGL